MNKYIYILIINILLIGCSHSSISDQFKNNVNGKTSRIAIASDDIAGPIMRVLAIDKYLILQAHQNTHHLFVYDLEKEKKTYELFHRGRGNKELISIRSLSPYKNGMLLYADMKILLNDSLYAECDKTCNTLKIKEVNNYYQMVPLNNKISVATGMFKESNKQFAILDQDFQIIDYNDDYPDCDNSLSSSALAQGFQGQIAVSSNGFVYASNIGGVMKFFEVNESSVSKLKEYLFKVPKFESVVNKHFSTVRQDRNNIVGTLSATASNDKYFMLYSDKALKEKIRTSNTIYCFDSDGLPDKKISLDREVEYIIYSKKMNKMYAIGTDDGFPYIYEVTY